jgi:hypothetical protein
MQRPKMLTAAGTVFLSAWNLAASRAADACEDEPFPTADLVMARSIEQREPVGADEPFVAGETVYAWTRVLDGEGAGIEHVWTKDGREVARHAMSIGGPRWRTWSRQRLTAGHYEVTVLAHGEVVATRSLDVSLPPVTRR